MNQLISVIIPAHNNASTLEEAVNSIINQTYKNLEVLIINDNSTDNTEAIAQLLKKRDKRIKYFKLEKNDTERVDNLLNRNINAGYSARNFGFTKSNGELITFQDGDDASLLNRIEIQCDLLLKHNATHITTDWIPFSEELLNTCGEIKTTTPLLNPNQIYEISQHNKGVIAKISPTINSLIPFKYKRLRMINKLFFGALDPYPGAGNSPLFKKEVIEKVQFRNLKNRIWPSFMGRGTDRDFNFQVAETFRNSYFFPIPLYLWRK